MKTENETAIKELVRDTYTKAVSRGEGCCTPAAESVTPCCPTQETMRTEDMKGVLVKAAGYTAEELATLPSDAVENAFGCGNPLAFAAVQPGQVVLDIGSGAGIDCLLAADRVGPTGRVIGLDMTPAMLEKARANARQAGVENVEFRMGEAENMPVDAGSVDWIISNCVINLSPDKDAVFREAFRVLKPGGQISISDIVAHDLPQQIRDHPKFYSSCISGAIPESEYINKLSAAGLVDIRVTHRIEYEERQLKDLVESEMGEHLWSSEERAVALVWAKNLSGKIASIKIYARKP